MGGLQTSKLVDYKKNDVASAVALGRLCYIGAFARYYHVGLVFRKYVDGHAWLIDGLRGEYVHCNFGWNGVCDGFYLSGVFDTTKGPTSTVGPNEGGISQYNYQYKQKIAIV